MMEPDHSPRAIEARLNKGPRQSYLRDWVYGGVDGVVTTFAVVSGVTGADLSSQTIVILGFANLLADGFSMGASNYLGTRTELEEFRHYERIERDEIGRVPEGEREEVRQILRAKGLNGTTLEDAVRAITSDQNRWLALMMAEEYGLAKPTRSAIKAAIGTWAAFSICGLVPLVPYIVGLRGSFMLSSVLTGLVFIGIGSLRSRWTVARWWRASMSTFLVGSAAAALAYFAGWLLRDFVS